MAEAQFCLHIKKNGFFFFKWRKCQKTKPQWSQADLAMQRPGHTNFCGRLHVHGWQSQTIACCPSSIIVIISASWPLHWALGWWGVGGLRRWQSGLQLSAVRLCKVSLHTHKTLAQFRLALWHVCDRRTCGELGSFNLYKNKQNKHFLMKLLTILNKKHALWKLKMIELKTKELLNTNSNTLLIYGI